MSAVHDAGDATPSHCAACREESEVKAEALREAASEVPPVRHRGKRNDPATLAAVGRWLRDRADRIEAQQ